MYSQTQAARDAQERARGAMRRVLHEELQAHNAATTNRRRANASTADEILKALTVSAPRVNWWFATLDRAHANAFGNQQVEFTPVLNHVLQEPADEEEAELAAFETPDSTLDEPAASATPQPRPVSPTPDNFVDPEYVAAFADDAPNQLDNGPQWISGFVPSVPLESPPSWEDFFNEHEPLWDRVDRAAADGTPTPGDIFDEFI
ncbi:hypothetical protein [Nereida ignava]|uniref:hypothetical protein n=1 Tax=Nereida ignava TaxID=282199 RepID=UPI0030FAAB9F